MPLYEYICLDCKTRFDALRPIRDADQPIACKNCSGEHTNRVLSVFFASSGGKSVAGTNGGGGCAGCGGGSCASCGH